MQTRENSVFGHFSRSESVSLLTLKLALGIALIYFPFSVSSFGKEYTDILSVFNSWEEQSVLHA